MLCCDWLRAATGFHRRYTHSSSQIFVINNASEVQNGSSGRICATPTERAAGKLAVDAHQESCVNAVRFHRQADAALILSVLLVKVAQHGH